MIRMTREMYRGRKQHENNKHRNRTPYPARFYKRGCPVYIKSFGVSESTYKKRGTDIVMKDYKYEIVL